MLRSVKELQGYTILAEDGDIGSVAGFYFDDDVWTIRYLVVDTGEWLSSRKVLIAPLALDQPDWERQIFPVELTQAQVEQSPDVDTTMAISRRQEADLHRYYRWPIYWTGGGGVIINQVMHRQAREKQESSPQKEADPHLRSTREVIGYHIQARDGEIGHVEDFIVDDQTWSINYMIVDTQNWLPGRKVVVSPSWIDKVSWLEAKVYIDLSRETVENSPEYDPTIPLNPDYENQLSDYYDRLQN
jgi:uncharacterized protein YrrD